MRHGLDMMEINLQEQLIQATEIIFTINTTEFPQ